MLLALGIPVSAAPVDARLDALIAQHGLKGRNAFENQWPDPLAPVTVLGRELFFSRALSGDGDTACASCHHPWLAGGDALSLPVGTGAEEPELLGPGRRFDWKRATGFDPDAAPGPNVPRNSPTIVNSGLYSNAIFHDGRLHRLGVLGIRSPESVRDTGRDLLAVQARLPVVSEDEMRGYKLLRHQPPDSVRDMLLERLRKSWPAAFARAFNDTVSSAQSVTYERIELALSDYQRSFVLLDNPWFRFLKGDREALNAAQKRGAVLFFADAETGGLGCVNCHSGDFFTDEKFHVLAMPQIGRGIKRPAEGYGNDTVVDGTDFGRYEVTRRKRDRYAFRTPSLLNVAVTAPFGHAGTFTRLEEVVRHHLDPEVSASAFDPDQLPQLQAEKIRYSREHTDKALAAWRANGGQPLPFTNDAVNDVVAFLYALTDPCMLSRSCLAPWMPEAMTKAPDGERLMARVPEAIAR